ncbi:MAG: hypothetical protein JKY07_06570, partial [SAR324 cluster bacterium]|nr:hypothetical protein [SAR324 cluster bacterium]
MTKKRVRRLLLLWLATFLMAGIVLILLYVQMVVHQENVVGSLEIESPEVTDDNTTIAESTEEAPESKLAVAGTVDIPEGTELSHLVETDTPFWNVFPISSAGVSAVNWHTILVQNRFKIDYTITPHAPREWHLVRINNSIRVQFR